MRIVSQSIATHSGEDEETPMDIDPESASEAGTYINSPAPHPMDLAHTQPPEPSTPPPPLPGAHQSAISLPQRPSFNYHSPQPTHIVPSPSWATGDFPAGFSSLPPPPIMYGTPVPYTAYDPSYDSSYDHPHDASYAPYMGVPSPFPPMPTSSQLQDSLGESSSATAVQPIMPDMSTLRAKLLADKLRRQKALKDAEPSTSLVSSEEDPSGTVQQQRTAGGLAATGSPMLEASELVDSVEEAMSTHRTAEVISIDSSPASVQRIPSSIVVSSSTRPSPVPAASTPHDLSTPANHLPVNRNNPTFRPSALALTSNPLSARGRSRMTAADLAETAPRASASSYRSKFALSASGSASLAPAFPVQCVIDLDSDEEDEDEPLEEEDSQAQVVPDADLQALLELKLRQVAESKAKLAAHKASRLRRLALEREKALDSVSPSISSATPARSPSPVVSQQAIPAFAAEAAGMVERGDITASDAMDIMTDLGNGEINSVPAIDSHIDDSQSDAIMEVPLSPAPVPEADSGHKGGCAAKLAGTVADIVHCCSRR